MTEEIAYRGRLIEIVHKKGSNGKTFEIARRGPGTRLILDDGSNVLLTREYRYETKDYDIRLPGGKVFDHLVDYENHLAEGHSDLQAATEAVKRESEQEVGLRPESLRFLGKSICGATVQWDLFYFACVNWVDLGHQDLESGEDISLRWTSYNDASAMAFDGQIGEDRSAIRLVRYLREQNS